jgi:hypothetical protein
VGGFDAYAFQIRVDMGMAPLDRSTLDRLQLALERSVPAWSSAARLSTLGRWPVRERFDVAVPGSLDEVIQAHRPGGARAKPTLGLAQASSSEMRARLTGADRGASITFNWIGSERSGEAASISHLVVETTQREVEGGPAGAWVERLFRAICAELAPPSANACSLGERMSAQRRGASGQVVWLTYVGPRAAGAVRRADLASVAGVDAQDLAGGILIRLDSSSNTRRTTAYWKRASAVEACIGRPPLRKVPRDQRDVAPPRPAAPPSPPPPTPLIPRPIVTMSVGGGRHIAGARYERMRFAGLHLREPGTVVEGFELVRCEFDNVGIGSKAGPPVTVRHCTLTRCRSRVAIFGLVVVEDCVIDGHAGGFWATASVLLRHVVLRGPIDAIDLRSPRQLSSPDHVVKAHHSHYRSVDWALDIRGARFKRCDIGGVPGHLVRRDPATQVLVTRERALAADWREATAGHFWRVAFERLLASGGESEVLVACPRGGRFAEELAVIARLREAGIAAPD